MTALAAAFLAHQGGWDEILLVAGPLAVFGGALYVANQRANAKLAAQAQAAQPAPTDAEPTDEELAEAEG
ncbi:MAG: hypothetical protein AAF567_24055 [Actinomycetota bacterium]